jgi:ureidoacrylate peracid hydrolase
VAIISDATASGVKRHYETTLERVRDYYGIVMDTEKFKEMIGKLDKIRKGEAKTFVESEEEARVWLEEFNLLDPRVFPSEQVNL